MEFLILSIIVTKYLNIFPHAHNGRSGETKFWQSDLRAQSECTIEIWSTLTYTEFDCAALLAMLQQSFTEVFVRDEIHKVYFFWEIIITHFTAGRGCKSHVKRDGHIPEIEMASMLTILLT